jgi:hypothetical protein
MQENRSEVEKKRNKQNRLISEIEFLILEKYPPKNLIFKYIRKSIHLE